MELKRSYFLLHSEPVAAVAEADPDLRTRIERNMHIGVQRELTSDETYDKLREGLKVCQGCGHLFLSVFVLFFLCVGDPQSADSASSGLISMGRRPAN